MPIARHYVIRAKAGEAETLAAELDRLGDAVRAVPGSLGFEAMQDMEDGHRFVFIEKWESVEAHKAASKHIPREAFGAFVAALDGPLSGSYLNYL